MAWKPSKPFAAVARRGLSRLQGGKHVYMLLEPRNVTHLSNNINQLLPLAIKHVIEADRVKLYTADAKIRQETDRTFWTMTGLALNHVRHPRP